MVEQRSSGYLEQRFPPREPEGSLPRHPAGRLHRIATGRRRPCHHSLALRDLPLGGCELGGRLRPLRLRLRDTLSASGRLTGRDHKVAFFASKVLRRNKLRIKKLLAALQIDLFLFQVRRSWSTWAWATAMLSSADFRAASLAAESASAEFTTAREEATSAVG